MRALCSVRGPLGGETRALGAGARLLALRMPGQPQPLHFVVEAKARVKELKSQANAHAQLQGMIDMDLFGLAVLQNGEYLFVDLESKLSKYAPKSWRSSHTHGLDANGKPLLELHLVVQFHVESPLLLHDEIGRHLYFLQLRSNVQSRDTLPAEILLLLTGLALQAEYGDAADYEDRDYFKVEEYAPTSLTGDWVASAMRACHREHRGLSKIDAETRFIREVCLLPDTINSHRYRLKQSKTESDPGTVWLLVTAKGIKILPDNGPLSDFIWSAIGKLSFDRKKFEIRTEEGKITLYSSSEEKCKYLFSLCKETHQFSMKIAPKLNEILRKEEEERKNCYGYSKPLNFQYNPSNKNEQRISVISSTSSNTTSGIVSDRVQSEDELEIMIDSPPAPSTESLAFAHLLDFSNSYFIRHMPQENQPLSKTSSLQMQKSKGRVKKSNENETSTSSKNDASSADVSQNPTNQLDETTSLPDQSMTESDSPVSNKLKCTGSQCSSSCSTVIMARAGLSALSRASNASSLELGYSHTAQNSMLSDNSTVGIDVEYSQDTASALYDGLGQPVTVAASSETSGVYTMGSSELTARSKMDTLSEDSRTDYSVPRFDSYKLSKDNDLADFDSVSSILKNKSERSSHSTNTLRLQAALPNADCVDGATNFSNQKHNEDENVFRERTNSNVSATSFHGDGSDPTDNKHNLLTASELSDLIVGRGVYPKSQSVSDTLDSVSDYVRLPLPFSGDSYIQGHEDTAPSDDNYPNNMFFDRPPTPPTRTDSRKLLNMSLPNILDIDNTPAPVRTAFPDKPPPPYEYNHKTLSQYAQSPVKAPPAYPGTSSSSSAISIRQAEKEEVAARVVTSKPMITILKAEAGEVNSSSERTFASPMVLEHRFQKSKRHQASSRRAERSKLAQGINNLSPSREPHGVDSNVLVAMMKLPPPPPPPRRTRLPPPPPAARLPPPPPPHNPMFHQQLYSDVDYVYYPMQDPAISQQNYLDHKLTETRVSNMHKTSLQYRSTPYLSTSLSASSMYGSIQNLSDSYVQLPGARTSWYSLTSRTSLSNHSINLERPPLPTRIADFPSFSRAKSDENILNPREPPPVKMRRMPPPPPPPYEHKKKLPTHLKEIPLSRSDASVSKTKDTKCDLDIKTLREKSKNLDLPLIAALCNDRSLLKQTKAFGAPKLSKQTGSDCESERKCAKTVQNTTDSLDRKKQESVDKRTTASSQKKILVRNPTDKLPALPSSENHTPRAMSNTYVMHPSVIKSKKTQSSS
ncbi:protein expanded [Ostrinia furnacalis]|uniref:protein expanded n=1 Tax=Ostrinia furnacalis TaxID=93504 RepID=UPI00103F34D6|nr:protein expanded [Ostrinia furnacalis]